MKPIFRIVTNGLVFRVERRGLFGWSAVGYNTAGGYGHFLHEEFFTKQAALNFIMEEVVDNSPEPGQWRVAA